MDHNDLMNNHSPNAPTSASRPTHSNPAPTYPESSSSPEDLMKDFTQDPPKKKRTGLKIFLIILFALLALGLVAILGVIIIVVFVLLSLNKTPDHFAEPTYAIVETMAPVEDADSDWGWEEEATYETEEEWYDETIAYTEATPVIEASYDYLDALNRKYDNYFDFYPDENGYILADSNSRYISSYDLYGMTEHEVCLARNEIYARHGYIFKSEKYNDYFSNFSWYYPYTTVMPDLGVLNTYEYENVQTIIAYEQSRGW